MNLIQNGDLRNLLHIPGRQSVSAHRHRSNPATCTSIVLSVSSCRVYASLWIRPETCICHYCALILPLESLFFTHSPSRQECKILPRTKGKRFSHRTRSLIFLGSEVILFSVWQITVLTTVTDFRGICESSYIIHKTQANGLQN